MLVAIGQDLKRSWRSLIVFVGAFKLLEAWILVPAVAWALNTIMARTGQVAVTDWDILNFVLTPLGFLYVCLLGLGTASLWLWEQGAVMVLLDRLERGESAWSWRLVMGAVAQAWRIVQLGLRKSILLVFALMPFVGLLGLTYLVLLSRQDINYYLSLRPSSFWLALLLGGLLVFVAALIAVRLHLLWALALPILLFEKQPAKDALRLSRERVGGIFWRVAGVLLGWQLLMFVLVAAVQGSVRWLAIHLPQGASESPIVLLLMLILQGSLLIFVAVGGLVGQALLVRRLYLSQSYSPAISPDPVNEDQALETPRVVRWLALFVLLALPIGVWVNLWGKVVKGPLVQVTAHRGHAKAAPENTRAAIEAAIRSGADYAEIDVQRTADGVVVLVHDQDVKRVTGDRRRVSELTLAQIQSLDAGSWFDEAFRGEKIPTLEEVIDLANGRIKLNIELKYYGTDERLAPEVGLIVRDKNFADQCVVTSFNHAALEQLNESPAGKAAMTGGTRSVRIRTGPIVAQALGNVTSLEGDVLSVRAELVNDRLLREAHQNRQKVFAWTVNDERQMIRLMMRGVDNILTSNPDLLIRVRDEWAARSSAEQMILASRILLGLE
jgi:glycerophosphoryl diester phosphodiesterase